MASSISIYDGSVRNSHGLFDTPFNNEGKLMLINPLFLTVIDDIGTAVNNAIQWAIGVSIFATAIMLAISIIAWLVHRS